MLEFRNNSAELCSQNSMYVHQKIQRSKPQKKEEGVGEDVYYCIIKTVYKIGSTIQNEYSLLISVIVIVEFHDEASDFQLIFMPIKHSQRYLDI